MHHRARAERSVVNAEATTPRTEQRHLDAIGANSQLIVEAWHGHVIQFEHTR